MRTISNYWGERKIRSLPECEYQWSRMLLRLLEQSKEPLVLCVAAHDIGEYVRHYPHGKKCVSHRWRSHSSMSIVHLGRSISWKAKWSSCVCWKIRTPMFDIKVYSACRNWWFTIGKFILIAEPNEKDRWEENGQPRIVTLPRRMADLFRSQWSMML